MGNVLTIKDLLEFLTKEIEANPEAADYQIGRYDYDDFAVGFTGFTFACSRINLIDLPKENLDDYEGVDPLLTTKKILTID